MQPFPDRIGVIAVGKNIRYLEVHSLRLHDMHEVLKNPSFSSAVFTNKTTAALSGYSACSLQEFQYVFGDILGEERNRSSNDDDIVIERYYLAQFEVHIEGFDGMAIGGDTVGKLVSKILEFRFVGFISAKQNADSHAYPLFRQIGRTVDRRPLCDSKFDQFCEAVLSAAGVAAAVAAACSERDELRTDVLEDLLTKATRIARTTKAATV